jgi:hypothetical protein
VTATEAPARLNLPDEVRDFGREIGLAPFVPALVEATEQVFADARRLTATLHDDPDVPGLRWIIFRAEVAWDDPAHARAARDDWYARTAAICPGPLLNHVGLDIDRRPE